MDKISYEPDNKLDILRFMNSAKGRSLRAGVGGMLLASGLRSGNPLTLLLGAMAFASGPLDFCPTNVALGYPLSGEETRCELARTTRE